MSADPGGSLSESPPTPPTLPYAPTIATPSKWPLVIGVIAIVLGALGALGNLWGAVSPLVLRAMSAQMSAMPGMSQNLAVMEVWRTWIAVSGLVQAAIALLLLLGGANLVGRRPSGPRLILWWAPFKILMVLIGALIGWQVQQDTLAAMQQAAPAAPNLATGAIVFGLVLGVLWGCAGPVFALIWFQRDSIKAEVSTWQAPQAALPPM